MPSSTTTTDAAALAPATGFALRRLAPYLALVGALLALAGFFLPWVHLADDVKTLAVLSGLQVAAGRALGTADGTLIFRGSASGYLVPLTALLAVGMGVLGLIRRDQERIWQGALPLGVALAGLLVLLVYFARAGQTASEAGVRMNREMGLLLAYLGLAVAGAAGALHLHAAVDRAPDARAVLSALGFMSPAAVLVLVFFFAPVLILLVISLTDLSSSNFSQPLNFIGLENYYTLFRDRFFPKILANTIRYVVLTLGFFNVGLALVLALLTTHINRRAGFFFRMLWLLPRITPSVVYILMWRRIAHQPPFGIINQLLGPFGLEQKYWLFEDPWLFVILVNGFVGASFGLIIFTSAIESIPQDFIVAAKVDGASTLQVIRDITLPLIKWPLLFVTTYQTLSLLTSFEFGLLLTEGGPGLFTTEVWALTAYKRALKTYFGHNQWGYGAAWGFILVIIGIILSVIYLRVFRFNELVQEPKIDAT